MCKNFIVIRYSIKELLAKSMVTRPMKCIVVHIKKFGARWCRLHSPRMQPPICTCFASRDYVNRVIMLNECEQLWASRAAQALDARLTNHVVAPSVNPA